jgi:two-component system, OmpR family, response regulator
MNTVLALGRSGEFIGRGVTMSDLGVAVVIEDDADMRNLLEAVLLQSGFSVHTAADGREGVDVVRRRLPNVVTVDVGLPDIDGFEVLRRIRQISDAYIVMLTGRSEELDMVTALNSGADDFITKPFRPRELRARIATMMRRPRQQASGVTSPGSAPAPAQPQDASVLRYNGLTLNTRTRTVAVRGAPLGLTRSEFDLLHDLMSRAGAVRSRSALVRVVRGDFYRDDPYVSESDERAVEVHIGNLRRKLGDDPDSPRYVQTVRGVGYRLRPGNPEEPV